MLDRIKSFARVVPWPLDETVLEQKRRKSLYVNPKDKDGICAKASEKLEDEFFEVVRKEWPRSIKVPAYSIMQMKHHVDVIGVLEVNEEAHEAIVVFIDIKTVKRETRRSKSPDYDFFWLELQSEYSNNFTWLGTKVRFAGPRVGPEVEYAPDDYILPDCIVVPEQGLVLNRKDLAEFAVRAVDWSNDFVRSSTSAVWRPYRRYGKSFEIITRGPIEEIIEQKPSTKYSSPSSVVCDDLSSLLESL